MGVEYRREGKTIYLKLDGEEVVLPPYPKLKSVEIKRVGQEERKVLAPLPPGVEWSGDPRSPPDYTDYTFELKANGSNIRVYHHPSLGEPIYFTRGGFLLSEANPSTAQALTEEYGETFRKLDGSLVLYGELVGPESLVRLGDLNKVFFGFFGREIRVGYILFDVWSVEEGAFLSPQEVREVAKKLNLKTPPTLPERMKTPQTITETLWRLYKSRKHEVWEGFIIKHNSRATTLEDKNKKTYKLRIDRLREFQLLMIQESSQKERELFQALRKGLIEGYEDPPAVPSSIPQEKRNEALNLIREGKLREAGEILEEYVAQEYKKYLPIVLKALRGYLTAL